MISGRRRALRLAKRHDSDEEDDLEQQQGERPPHTRPNNTGMTPLMSAAKAGDAGAVRLLLSFSAPVNVSDNKGRTALMFAAQSGCLGSALLLIGAGESVKAVDSAGMSPAAYAVISGSEAMVQLMVDCGADLEAVDADGNSLVSLAAAGGCYGTLRLILHLQGLQPETAGPVLSEIHLKSPRQPYSSEMPSMGAVSSAKENCRPSSAGGTSAHSADVSYMNSASSYAKTAERISYSTYASPASSQPKPSPGSEMDAPSPASTAPIPSPTSSPVVSAAALGTFSIMNNPLATPAVRKELLDDSSDEESQGGAASIGEAIPTQPVAMTPWQDPPMQPHPSPGGVELDYNSLHALLNTPAIREDILDLISNSPQLMSKLGAFAAANGSNNKPQSVGSASQASMVPSRKPAQPFQFDVKHQYQEDAQSAATEPAQPLRQVPFSPGHQLWQQMLASSSDGLLSTSPDQELSRFGNVPESPAFPVNLSAHMNNAALGDIGPEYYEHVLDIATKALIPYQVMGPGISKVDGHRVAREVAAAVILGGKEEVSPLILAPSRLRKRIAGLVDKQVERIRKGIPLSP